MRTLPSTIAAMPLWLAAALILLPAAAVTHAYQLPVNPLGGAFTPTAPPVSLSGPQVLLVSQPTAARLQQLPQLVAHEEWDDAIDALRVVASSSSDRLVAVNAERYVSAPLFCQMQLARLPAAGLARYRQRVDALAESLYRDGLAQHREASLQRVVDEFFGSSWGDDALLALGEMALDRADYDAARRYFEQISPLLRDPDGRSLWLALRAPEWHGHMKRLLEQWSARTAPPDWLAYPDTPLDLAQMRADLILVSIRAGQLDRAAGELDAFRQMHPQAVGRLGGQVVPLTAALDRLLTTVREWPAPGPNCDWTTFAGSPSRNAVAPPLGPLTGPVWREPIQMRTIALPAVEQIAINGAAFATDYRGPRRPLTYHPVAAGGLLYYADNTQIHAAHLADGRPAMAADGTIFREAMAFDSDAVASPFATSAPQQFTLSLSKNILFARLGDATTARANQDPSAKEARLVGLDLSRDGLLALGVRPSEQGWAFDGVPVSDGRRLFVAMRQSDVNPRGRGLFRCGHQPAAVANDRRLGRHAGQWPQR